MAKTTSAWGWGKNDKRHGQSMFSVKLRTRRWRPLVEELEDRNLLSVIFAPGPVQVPTVNRPDIAPGDMQDGPIEPFISVNPTDPGNLAVTSQNGLQVTGLVPNNSNGPIDFTPAAAQVYPLAPGYTGNNGDTATTYDALGRLFWANLESPAMGFRDVVVTQVNPTTGAIIGNPVPIPHPAGFDGADKEFIAADSNPNSPFANNLYVSLEYYNSTDDEFEVFVSRSTDHGVTWSTPQQLSVNSGANSEGFTWPSSVTVAPNGDVYVAYHAQPDLTDNDVEGSEGGDDDDDDGGGAGGGGGPGMGGTGNNPTNGTSGEVIVFRSTDGGVTFPTAQRTVAFTPGLADITFNRQDAMNDRNIAGTQFWTMGSAQPWVLADPTRPGFVYVVTADDPNNGSTAAVDHSDIVFARSGNNGANWITSTIEAGPSNSFQFFPNASIDQFGTIVVSWYTNASLTMNGGGQFLTATNGNGDFLLNVWARYSTDGGLTWSPAFQINDQPIDPDVAVNNRFAGPPVTTRIGEYFGLANFGGTAYVAWRDSSRDAMNNPVGPSRVLFDAFAINGSLTVTGDDGGGPVNDNIVLRQIANDPGYIEVLVNGQRQYAGLLDGIAGGIKVNGLSGNDTVTVDFSNGNPIPAGGLDYDGGTGFDQLILQGGVDTSDIYSPGLSFGSGKIDLTAGATAGSATAATIVFENLAPVLDVVAGPLVVNGTPSANAINYGPGLLDAVNNGRVTVDNLEPIEFSNKTVLTLNGLEGSDEINIANFGTPLGLTGITVNGGSPGGSDSLVITGTSAAEAFEYAPTGGPGNGTVVIPGPDVAFSEIESVVIDGGSTINDDSLLVRTEAGADLVTLEPGASVDSGTFHIKSTAGTESTPPLTFRALGQDSFIELRSGAGAGSREDTFEYQGTDTPDTFTVTNANGGTIALQTGAVGPNLHKEVRGPGIAALILQGLNGDDTFTVAADNNPFTGGTTVNGDDGNDLLTFTGSAAAEVFTLTANGVRLNLTRDVGPVNLDVGTVEHISLLAGAGADQIMVNDLSLTPVKRLDLDLGPADAAADSVVVNGTNTDDNILITSGSVDIGGLAYHVGIANSTRLDGDTLTVNGNDGNDTIKALVGVETQIRLILNGGRGDDRLNGGGILTGGEGLDTLDFSDFRRASSIDLDAVGAVQTTTPFAFGLTLGDVIENFLGSPFPEVIHANVIGVGRSIDGGGGDDLALIDTKGQVFNNFVTGGILTSGAFGTLTWRNISQIGMEGNSLTGSAPLVRVEKLSKVVYNRRTKRFVQKIKFRNVSETLQLNGSQFAVLAGLKKFIKVQNKTGTTAALLPVGTAFLRYDPPNATLEAGDTFHLKIVFTISDPILFRLALKDSRLFKHDANLYFGTGIP